MTRAEEQRIVAAVVRRLARGIPRLTLTGDASGGPELRLRYTKGLTQGGDAGGTVLDPLSLAALTLDEQTDSEGRVIGGRGLAVKQAGQSTPSRIVADDPDSSVVVLDKLKAPLASGEMIPGLHAESVGGVTGQEIAEAIEEARAVHVDNETLTLVSGAEYDLADAPDPQDSLIVYVQYSNGSAWLPLLNNGGYTYVSSARITITSGALPGGASIRGFYRK